jgi:glycine/D-amino acid oxidase-like deaminating enzyme
VSAAFRHGVGDTTRAVRLEKLDETISEAKTGSQSAETRHAIFAGRFGAEELFPTPGSRDAVRHGHLHTV